MYFNLFPQSSNRRYDILSTLDECSFSVSLYVHTFVTIRQWRYKYSARQTQSELRFISTSHDLDQRPAVSLQPIAGHRGSLEWERIRKRPHTSLDRTHNAKHSAWSEQQKAQWTRIDDAVLLLTKSALDRTSGRPCVWDACSRSRVGGGQVAATSFAVYRSSKSRRSVLTIVPNVAPPLLRPLTSWR